MNSNKDYFNKLALNWDNIISHDRKKIDLILELTNLKSESKILDIGTGTGVLINSLLKSNPKEIVAIDISDKMIEMASKKYKNKNVRFLISDFYDFNLRGFNYAICYSAYPHFLEKRLFINKIKSVLIPGGRFVIAHSQGRNIINYHHNSSKVSKISKSLNSAIKEAQNFSKFFNIDILVDTEEFYIISGIKKADQID